MRRARQSARLVGLSTIIGGVLHRTEFLLKERSVPGSRQISAPARN
jgi:hypothetical protein